MSANMRAIDPTLGALLIIGLAGLYGTALGLVTITWL